MPRQPHPILESAIDQRRWQSVLARESAGADAFVYAVLSTGIFCRPDCPARRPRPRNVRFFSDAAEAARHGFRPCRRCRPELAQPAGGAARAVAELCRVLEAAERPPSLAQLAARSGWSVSHLQRTFKAVTGLSPRDYARAQRAERARAALTTTASVTEAMQTAGYDSSGRFYEDCPHMLGMTPTRYRAAGQGEKIRFALARCSLGALLVAGTERGICAISLGDEPEPLLQELQERFARAELVGGDAEFEGWVAQVVAAVEQPTAASDLPLDLRGSAFQKRVWLALRDIPVGETRSYRALAESLGAPSGARAVARACASNSVAVVVPCHRVVRSDGNLAGYRWGIARKRALLERERGGR